jgi:XRE family transcriptional regulator of biofilm formation
MNYAKAIRIARSIADLSQAELADRTGLDRSYLSLIEGEKRSPSTPTIEHISKALDIPFHLLTLLATEKEDTDRLNEEQVNSLAKQLTRLLLEKEDSTGDFRSSSKSEAGGRKLSKTRVPARSNKRNIA